MARTTEADVKKIVKVKPTINDANALTEALVTATTVVDSIVVPRGYDETLAADIALLSQIEKYLAAHFFCIFAPRREYEMAKTVAQRIETKVDLGFNVTRYGQQAMMLDRLGGLKIANDPKNAGGIGITWLGTERT